MMITKKEQELIKNWDSKYIFLLIEYLCDRWQGHVKQVWGKRLGQDVLFVEFHTKGLSSNETIINALLHNSSVKSMWYYKWERGGHHYFEINPSNIGFKKVTELAKEMNVSRQYLHKYPNKFDWITVGLRTQMVRIKIK